MTQLLKFRQNAAATLLLCLCAATTTLVRAQQRMVTVPAGTRLLVRMMESVETGRNRAGTLFTARLQGNLMAGNQIVARDGAIVHGRVSQSSSAGRVAGRSELQLELTDIMVNNSLFPIFSTDYSVSGGNSFGRSARRTLTGAGLGTAIGAIGGNAGRGAAIGAVGGGVGSMVSRGEQINVPAGT